MVLSAPGTLSVCLTPVRLCCRHPPCVSRGHVCIDQNGQAVHLLFSLTPCHYSLHKMTEEKDDILELGPVPSIRDSRNRSSSYTRSDYAPKFLSSGADPDSDSDSPHKKQQRSKEQMAISGILLLQLVLVCLSVFFYNKWYSVTAYGSSALISCFLCGFAQGLLQLIVHRKSSPSNLLKYYVWGIFNGIWTVCEQIGCFEIGQDEKNFMNARICFLFVVSLLLSDQKYA